MSNSFIMVVGEYPFPIQGNIMLLFEDIAAGKFEVPDWVDPECSDLISQMLQTNPTERIDLAGIRTHPFVKNSISKSIPVPTPTIHSMWPHHDKSTLSGIIKKMKPQLEREEEQERASRFSFDIGRPSFEEANEERPRPSQPTQSKCAIM
jgi:serine/threonine protein kinase